MSTHRKRAVLILILLLTFMVFTVAQAQDATPEITPEATPDLADTYVVPADPEGIDLTQVIATVRDEQITLGQLRARVRFDRFRNFELLAEAANRAGVGILDVNDPNNQIAGQLRVFLRGLADDQGAGENSYNDMIEESLYRQEAVSRGVEVDDCALLTTWTQVLNLDAPLDCTAPEGYETTRQNFIRRAGIYSGLTEDEIGALVLSRAQQDAVLAAVRAETNITEVATVTTRHIRVSDEAVVNDIVARLRAGESWDDLMVQYSEDMGRGGQLPAFGAGQMVAPFEEAAFGAEVGEVVGPVQTDFGYHVIEVLDRQAQKQVGVVVFETIDEAQTAFDLLRDGADIVELAQLYSVDTATKRTGGDMGFISPGRINSIEADTAIFSAAEGDVLGPFQISDRFYVFKVGGEQPLVTARHILVNTEEQAQYILDQLGAGVTFEQLAKLSIDPSGAGGGDTLFIASGGQLSGAYAQGEILNPNDDPTQTQLFSISDVLPEVVDAAFDAEAGDISGPIATTQFGYFVVEVEEKGSRPANQTEIDGAIADTLDTFQTELLASADITRTDLWRSAVPSDPTPSDVTTLLNILGPTYAEITADVLQDRLDNNIPNTLGDLMVPVPTQVFELEVTPEATPGN